MAGVDGTVLGTDKTRGILSELGDAGIGGHTFDGETLGWAVSASGLGVWDWSAATDELRWNN